MEVEEAGGAAAEDGEGDNGDDGVGRRGTGRALFLAMKPLSVIGVPSALLSGKVR